MLPIVNSIFFQIDNTCCPSYGRLLSTRNSELLKAPKLVGSFSVTEAAFVIMERVSPAGQADDEDVRLDYVNHC